MDDEVWRSVVGYDSIYEVSNFGQVRRVGKSRGATVGKVLRAHRKPNGYLFLDLYCCQQRQVVYVHRLVALAFLGPIPEGYEVNHKDGDKTNPHVENLEYVTRTQNMAHALAVGLAPQGESVHSAKLSQDDVHEIRSLEGSCSQHAIARMFGVSRSTVEDILARRTWREMPPEERG